MTSEPVNAFGHFADRLVAAVDRTRTPAIVGIDPRPERFPPTWQIRESEQDLDAIADWIGHYCEEILAIVAGRVPAVKFQAACFEAYGPAGMRALHRSCDEAARRGLLVILDGKRNDIGSTAEAYAQAYLGRPPYHRNAPIWRVDALTLNPYLGSDGIQPFLEAAQNEGRGVFVLVRTSNPSAREFQDLVCDGESLFQRVAARLRAWAEPYRGASGYSLAGAVVGATYPEELAGLRRAMPGVLFLVPGYGAQGGTARDVASAFDSRGRGAIINSSRGIIEAYLRPEMKERFGDDWQEAVSAALDHMIEDLAVHTPAGALRMGSATGSS